jgi:hypothetical protein
MPTPFVVAAWEQMPSYVVGYCPFCSANSIEKIDTHSLHYWYPRPEKNGCVFKNRQRAKDCHHFVAVHTFVNVNDKRPHPNPDLSISSFFNDNGDLPFVIPDLLPNAFPAIAVMHALPICAIEGDAFVPRYSLYMITYYAEDPKAVKEYRWRNVNPDPGDFALLLEFPDFMRRHPESANLQQWVERGKLQWLDPATPDLTLRTGPVAAFPYAGLTGFGRKYTYRPVPVSVPAWAFWRKRRLREGGRIELR